VSGQRGDGHYTESDEQRAAAEKAKSVYEREIAAKRYGPITTEIVAAGPFFYAEGYHQQYLDANPNGYCGLGGTGVSCPVGVGGSTD